MRYLRQVDLKPLADGQAEVQLLAHWETGIESCVILISRSAAHAKGTIGLHRHAADQFYFTLRGQLSLRLADEDRLLAPHTLAYVPEGWPHMNWNSGPDEEMHLEVLAPSSLSFKTIAEEVSGDTDLMQNAGAPWVRDIDLVSPASGEPFAPIWLANRETGSSHLSILLGQLAPGAAGPGLHIHKFDQFYFVLAGTLHVQIGLNEYQAQPNTLVALPAGVPHRQWNGGTVPEQHLIFLVPEPAKGEPAEVGITLRQPNENT